MSVQDVTLWRRIILAGHQLFRSTAPISAYDFNKYLTPHSPRLRNTSEEIDHSTVSRSVQPIPSNRHTLTSSTDYLSSHTTVSPGRLVKQSLSDSMSTNVPPLSSSSMSTTPINAIVSLPALSMSATNNAPRGTSSSSSNPVLLIQALASILAGSESSTSSRGGLIFPSLSSGVSLDAQHLNGNNISFLPPSTALSLRELFGSRISNNGSSLPTTGSIMSKTATSLNGAIGSSGAAVTCVLRLPTPTRSTCSYFLVVASTGPRSLVSGTDTGIISNTPTSDGLKGSRSPFGQRGLISIYNLDKLLIQIAEKQDRGLKEIAKLKFITALLQSRHSELKIESDNENKGEAFF